MKSFRILIGLVLLGVLASPAAARKNPVTWTARLEPQDVRAGEAAQVVLEATAEDTWYIYSQKRVEGGPIPTTIELIAGTALKPDGAAVEPTPQMKFDEGFQLDLPRFAGAAAFGLPVRIAEGAAGKRTATVKVRFQACNPKLCLPARTVELPVEFTVAAGAARAERLQAVTRVPDQPAGYKGTGDGKAPAAAGVGGPPADGGGGVGTQIDRARSQGLLAFLWLSLTMGFLALLTPCVFPMVPITVSFFSKQGEGSERAGVGGAVAYCLGIIGTFTGLGLLMTVLFGASGISRLATNPIVNLGLAVLFVVLAINLFGGFQIVLPASLVEKTQMGTGRGGLIGPMLMGLTFTLTSFTCTVPFVGTLLATTTQGSPVWPVAGMLAFSTAFASPFFLLALFPQWLARLPKSGGWLVTVKAFMGFVELAAAVKFLSNADLVWAWGLLTRPVFLSLWSTIALVAGFYLLGWLKMPHDSGSTRPGGFRLGMGAATVLAGFYCLAAIGGKSLGELDAFLPPSRYPGHAGTALAAAPGEVRWTEDYDAALEQARREGKPLFLNFTGVTCTNCRWMESNMFTRADVARELEKFVAVELFTDRSDAQSIRYKKLEEDMYDTVALPLYAVISADGTRLAEFDGLTRNPAEFVTFLQQAHAKFAESRPKDAGRVAQNP